MTIILLGLTMDEVLSQGILFLPAGYDTTASAITFLLYNLALHPEIQEKLHQEIVDVTGNEVCKMLISINTALVCFK